MTLWLLMILLKLRIIAKSYNFSEGKTPILKVSPLKTIKVTQKIHFLISHNLYYIFQKSSSHSRHKMMPTFECLNIIQFSYSYFYLSTQLFIRLVYTQSVFRPKIRFFNLSIAKQFFSLLSFPSRFLSINTFFCKKWIFWENVVF